jgi:peptide/nickel transport system permease protein
MPSNPVALIADSVRLRPEQYRRLAEIYGFDRPIWDQYLRYMVESFQGFYGYSYYTQRPVGLDIMERLPNTLLLIGTSTILAILIGMAVGIVAAARRGSAVDVSAITFGFLGYSVPTFWLGMIFLWIFGYYLRIFPLRGTMSVPAPTDPLLAVFDTMWHLALPCLTLVIIQFGGDALVMRAAMMDTLTEDYIMMARAKGLDERTVLYRHALKNAMLPMVTVIALSFGFILTGAILTETVYSWHGLGTYIWASIQGNDYPALQGIFFIVSVMVVLCNFIADIIYGILDPRVRFG